MVAGKKLERGTTKQVDIANISMANPAKSMDFLAEGKFLDSFKSAIEARSPPVNPMAYRIETFKPLESANTPNGARSRKIIRR